MMTDNELRSLIIAHLGENADVDAIAQAIRKDFDAIVEGNRDND